MKTKGFILFLTAFLFNVVVGGFVSAATGFNPLAVIGGGTVLSGFLSFGNTTQMAIQKEIWMADIVGNLFKTNPHLNYAMNADEFVLAGKVVHIPNAGAKPTVVKNRSTFPATVKLRQDADITFTLDEYTSDPMKIENAEKYELSYDKRQSVISEQSNAIAELIGDWMLYYWRPETAANIQRTTGDAVAAHTPDATGNRKKVTVADIKAMQKTFNKLNISKVGRYAMLDADMYDQLTDSMTATQYKDFSNALNLANGTVGTMYGFTFLDSRSNVLTYTNATLPVAKEPGATGAAADNAAGLFWQQDCVIRALGQQELFETIADPTHYGDIYSALVRAGGRKKRSDGYGVIALVQAAA